MARPLQGAQRRDVDSDARPKVEPEEENNRAHLRR